MYIKDLMMVSEWVVVVYRQMSNLFSHIMARTNCNDEMEHVRFALEQHVYIGFMVLAH